MNKKRIIISLLMFSMVFGYVVPVFGIESVPVTREEQIQAIQNDSRLTDDEKFFHIDRLLAIDPDPEIRKLSTFSNEGHILLENVNDNIEPRFAQHRLLNVRHFPQIRNYWCGPAVLQQTFNFLGNNSWDQQRFFNYILNRWGATTGDIPILAAVASNYTCHRYQSTRIENQSLLGQTAFDAMNLGITPMIRMEAWAHTAHHWPFATRGHFVNITGVEFHQFQVWSEPMNYLTGEIEPRQIPITSVTRVRVTDPFVGSRHIGDPGGSPHFWVSLNSLHTVMTVSHRNVEDRNFAW